VYRGDDAAQCLAVQPGSHRHGEMVFEAVTQAVRKLFLNVQLQAAVHPGKMLHISIIADS
jgi:hypothetical protein